MSLADVALRQQLLAQRVKLGRLPIYRQLSAEMAGVLRHRLAGMSDDAFAKMRKAAFLSFVADINQNLSRIFVGFNGATMDFLAAYITFDVEVATLLYAAELDRDVKLVAPSSVVSRFNAAIIPANGATPQQTLNGLLGYSVGQICGRVRLAQPNAEKPSQTLQAILGDDTLRNVGSILAKVMTAAQAADATLIQAAHIITNSSVMAVA